MRNWKQWLSNIYFFGGGGGGGAKRLQERHYCHHPAYLLGTEFKIQRRGRQRERQKNNWFN